MCDDPIVAEVRAARERFFAECDYDMKKVIERGHEIVKNWPGKVVTKEDLQRERRGSESKAE
jgi:hypothetical protein